MAKPNNERLGQLLALRSAADARVAVVVATGLAMLTPPAAEASTMPRVACDTARFLPLSAGTQAQLAAARTRHRDVGTALPRAAVVAAQRDAFGTFPHVRTSAHFAVKWGDGATVDPSDIDRMVLGLEAAWSGHIDERGWLLPLGAADYLVNVYVTGTAPHAPEGASGLAYVHADPEGFPFIGVGPDFVALFGDSNLLSYGDSTLVHEFNHVLQLSTDAFWGLGDWWMVESTAQWMATEVMPDAQDVWLPAGFFALTQHLPLSFVSATRDHGSPADWRDYGVSLFHSHLAASSTPEVLRDAWMKSGPSDGALTAIGAELTLRGQSFSAFHDAFVVRNILWKYPQAEHLAEAIATVQQAYPTSGGHVLTVHLGPEGTLGGAFAPAPLATLPSGWGYNVIRFDAPAAGIYEVALDADRIGTRGTTSAKRMQVVTLTATGSSVVPIDVADGTGNVTVELREAGSVYLAVTETATAQTGEQFLYSYRIGLPVEEHFSGGCAVGAAATQAAGQVLWLLGLAVWLRRPRRRAYVCARTSHGPACIAWLGARPGRVAGPTGP